MKKITSIFISLVMFSLLLVPVSATEAIPQEVTGSTEYMIDFLIERGYPADYLNSLPSFQVENLYQVAFKHNAYFYDLSMPTDAGISPYGTIPSEKFSLSVVYSYLPIVRDGVTYFDEFQ